MESAAASVDGRRIAAHALLWLTAANGALALYVGYGYLAASALEPLSAGWTFALIAVAAQLGTAVVVLGLLLIALATLAAGARGLHRRVLGTAAALAFTLLQLGIYVDRRVYDLFRYHVNGLVLGIASTRAGWEAMQIPPLEVQFVLAVAALLFVFERATFDVLVHRARVAGPAVAPQPAWLVLVTGVAVLAVVDHVTYAVGDLRGIRTVTGSAVVVPLYRPFTLKRVARRFMTVPDDAPAAIVHAATGTLHYPRAPLVFHQPPRLPNIVWLVVESWRRDALNPENTPHAWRFAERAQLFRNHVSGGNGTRYGVFSMFYGLHGAYWERVRSERPGPVLIHRLRELGYDIHVLSSTPLDYAELRPTVFGEVADRVKDRFEGSILDHDRLLTERLAAVIDAHGDRPFFAFLFFDSTHQPYEVDPAFAPYSPYANRLTYSEATSAERPEIYNRYRDALAYVDHLLGEVVQRLDETGLLRDTVVVVTGDHGEEVFEHGRWGHGADFTEEEVAVPLVLYVPERAPAVHEEATSHQDLAPTFLEMLGIENPPEDYSVGRSLLRPRPEHFQVSCGWGECALVDQRGSIVFGTEPYNARSITVRDRDYREVDDPQAVLRERAPDLLALMRETTTFVR